MFLISLLLAILLERFFPAPFGVVEDFLSNILTVLKKKLNSGDNASAITAWFSLTFVLSSFCWLIWILLSIIHPILSLLFSIIVLYLSFGFSNFINRFTTIQSCLKNDQLEEARKHLHDWATFVGSDPVVFETAKSGDISSVSRETVRLAILAAQRNLFGVIFWYVVLPGPIGPVIYRISVQAMRSWNDEKVLTTLSDENSTEKQNIQEARYKKPQPDFFANISIKGFFWVDWVSSRVTAFIFAIVGNFEDAIQMIRARSAIASNDGYDSERILLSAGEGAMTLRLTIPIAPSGSDEFEKISSSDYVVPELREVDENSLKVAVGLIWRSLFLWCFVMLLVTLGYLSNLLN
jgi:cobalamin biosynthesis protein CobD/CbiB